MYRGRFPLGEEVALGVLCRNGAGTESRPDECPSVDVWSAAARVYSGKLPPPDLTNAAGWFSYRLFLGSAFAAGQYRAFYRYRVGGVPFMEADTFEVTAGGSVTGPVIAVADFNPPHAEFLVQQSQSGQYLIGQNPQV